MYRLTEKGRIAALLDKLDKEHMDASLTEGEHLLLSLLTYNELRSRGRQMALSDLRGGYNLHRRWWDADEEFSGAFPRMISEGYIEDV